MWAFAFIDLPKICIVLHQFLKAVSYVIFTIEQKHAAIALVGYITGRMTMIS